MNLRPANQGIRDFLASYCRLESPGYAVMITGEWGAGKTWLVNEIMKQEGFEYLRISLFGVSTRQEVQDEFFARCHPMLASAGAKVVAGIARGILSRVTFPIGSADMQSQSQLESLGLKDLMINVKDKIVILDDLERCRLPARESLGIISNLLEEDGCKVIIIANENEIKDTEYPSYKEKVVAYTFKAEPEAELALDQFWNVMARHRLDDKSANEIKETIGIVHDQSGYMNLRHLKISLEAFERLYSCLPDSAKQKGDLVNELLYIHSVFSYEVLHGDVSGDQVIALFPNLSYGIRVDSQRSDIAPIDMLANKYRPSLARDFILDSDTWINLFAKGRLDEEAIRKSIEQSRFFINERTPTWRRLLEVWSISNDELNSLIAQLQKDIIQENFSNVGEILHVTGILLWLSKSALYSELPETIAENSISLLNSLHSERKLELRPGVRLCGNNDDVFGNIKFFEWTNPLFQKVLEHGRTIEKEIYEFKLMASATALLDLLPDDTVGFCRQLVHAHLGDKHSLSGLYADEPVLASTDSSRFVQSVMDLKPRSRRHLLYGIAQRYKHPEVATMLVSELKWLERVHEGLRRELAAAGTSLEALQLKSAIDEYVNPSIENLRAASACLQAPQDSGDSAKG